MTRRLRSALRGLSTVLIVSGSLLVLDALVTIVWQEPVSAFLAARDQGRLSDDLEELESQAPSDLEQEALAVLEDDRQRVAFLARAQRRRAEEGRPVGRIRIPAIGANYVVVYGTTTEPLKKGPGLYPETSFPGLPGTTAIAGHRTTYGAPFNEIDDIGKGDEIVLEMPYARLTYVFERQRIVEPTALWVVEPVGYDRIVLTACHPLYSAAQRIVVFARLTDVEARGSAAGDQTLVEKAPALQ